MFKASTLFVLLSYSFGAQALCIGEAQINGKISKIKKSPTSCRAFLTAETPIQQSGLCPIDEGRLNSEGIEVGLLNGHDCRMEAGELISGILVDNGYTIYLE